MAGEATACAARRLGADADAVLARIGGRAGVDARAAAATLAKLAPREERVRRAQWLATARLPVPAGFRSIHATWIEAALAELPARARTAVADGGDATDVWLARRALAGFVAMPMPSTNARTPDELPGLASDALRAWLERAGSDQLARAAQIASGVVLATSQFGSDREILQRCVGVANDELRLVRLGARVVAPHVDDVVRRQIIQRLPRALGLAIRADLDAVAAVIP